MGGLPDRGLPDQHTGSGDATGQQAMLTDERLDELLDRLTYLLGPDAVVHSCPSQEARRRMLRAVLRRERADEREACEAIALRHWLATREGVAHDIATEISSRQDR